MIELEPQLKQISGRDSGRALTMNQEAVCHLLRLLVYVRFVSFRIFLECAAAMNGGITEDHKRRWFLAQLAPETLFKQLDTSESFTRYARGASSNYLARAILDESRTIKNLYQIDLPHFGCSMKHRF